MIEHLPYGSDEWLAAANDQLATQPCYKCGDVGGVTLAWELHAHPLGTWSLAGAQDKASATRVLIASHEACGFRARVSRMPESNPGPPPGFISDEHRAFYERYGSYSSPEDQP